MACCFYSSACQFLSCHGFPLRSWSSLKWEIARFTSLPPAPLLFSLLDILSVSQFDINKLKGLLTVSAGEGDRSWAAFPGPQNRLSRHRMAVGTPTGPQSRD